MNDHAFMLDPERWPEMGFGCKKIFLKRGPGGQEMARLDYLNGRWGFCPESTPFERWGGKELVDEIIKAGWIVD